MKQFKNLFFLLLLPALMLTGCNDSNSNEPTRHKVTFDSQGGSDVQSVIVEDGAKVTKPADPTRTDYIFGGWFKEANAVNAWNFSTDVVTSNITLYAQWLRGVTYTVKFETNGGSTIDEITVAEGGTVRLPNPPSKPGRAFEGWYTESTFQNLYDFDKPITSNLTLYAKWADISRETLADLVQMTNDIREGFYTRESYANMIEKRDQANGVLWNPSASNEEIEAAYVALQKAIDDLVETEHLAPNLIGVYPKGVDDYMPVYPGKEFYISADAETSPGIDATDNRVIYDNIEELKTWAKSDWSTWENNVSFTAREDLPLGSTLTLTIRSQAVSSVVTTVKLKVVSLDEVFQRFLDAVEELPSPSNIGYDHYDQLVEAEQIYERVYWEDYYDHPAYVAAERKLWDCWDAYDELPERLKYTHKGNDVYKLEFLQGSSVYTVGEFKYAGSSFPVGTLTQVDWVLDEVYNGKEYWTQWRITLSSYGELHMESRTANSSAGANPSDWEEDGDGTYTVSGGIIYVKINDEDFAIDGKATAPRSTKRKPSKFIRD